LTSMPVRGSEPRKQPVLGPSFFFILSVVLSCRPAVSGQTTHPPRSNGRISSALKLAAVKVTGTERYKPADVIAGAGLKIGSTVTDEELKQASARLGESGAFSGVSYTYQYSAEGATLELRLTDADKFVPAKFDNLVWFSDQEIADKIHEFVPLYRGTLPVTGNLADQVSDALQAMLIERKIAGHADYLRADEDNGVSALLYSVTGPSIHIRNVNFLGVGPGEREGLERLAKPLTGGEYSRTRMRTQAEKEFLPLYLARGYLKAAVSDVRAAVVQQTPEETGVDVTFVIEPGREYKLGEFHWSGNSLFPSTKLQSLMRSQPGLPVDAVRLSADLDTVTRLYGNRGYVAAKVQSTPQFNEANATVSYQFEVREGDVYRMGILELQGLDDRDARQVQAKWSMAKGDLYDSSYPKRFLDDAFRTALLDEAWRVSVHETPDADDKTVDVTLRFYRIAPN
jgi:outer membrane protein assembly factor BamA